MNITRKEQTAIDKLQALAKEWPDSLWIFSGAGTLWVMKKKNGKPMYTRKGGVDPDYQVDRVPIDNDGGDWD